MFILKKEHQLGVYVPLGALFLVIIMSLPFQVVLENSGRADKHDCPFVQASIKLTKILCDFLKIGEARKSSYYAFSLQDSIDY